MKLTDEQKSTIDELRAAVKDMYEQADDLKDEAFAILKNGGITPDYDKLWDEIEALESEAAMKALIAHVPKAGERRVGRVKKALAKAGFTGYDGFDKTDKTTRMDARVDALDGINAWRDSLGLPPLDRMPVGAIGSGSECTIAKALKQEFNDFRTMVSIEVGGGGSTVNWVERIPYSDEKVAELRNKMKSWDYEKGEINPDFDSSITNFLLVDGTDMTLVGIYSHDDYAVDVKKLFGQPHTIKVNRSKNWEVNGQSMVVSAFDQGMYPDLVRDEDLGQGLSHCVENGYPDIVTEYLDEYRRRFPDRDLNEKINEDTVDHLGGTLVYADDGELYTKATGGYDYDTDKYEYSYRCVSVGDRATVENVTPMPFPQPAS